MSSGSIDSNLHESRVFAPPAEFAREAHVASLEQYQALWESANNDVEAFWGEAARGLRWSSPWSKVLEWSEPHAKWFLGATINVSDNCLDRHCEGPNADKPALVWVGEPGDSRTLTYRELRDEVAQFANALKAQGIGKGDVVAIYMPMVPEAAIAMLACARIGAPHTVVFGGFSGEALAGRINDSQAKALITADGGYRRGKAVPLKVNADAGLKNCPTIRTSIVLKRTGDPVNMESGRDIWWHDAVANVSSDCAPEPLDSEHPLFVLYTSGSTGKPKGIVHTTGGYLLGTSYTHKLVFDLKPNDVYFCTADVGWITGHSYLVYGPLANAATVVMYEGAPDFPDKDRFWKIIADTKTTIFYTAPTAIRAFIKWGDEYPGRHDLTSLRLLGTVGEPINPQAWMWYRQTIGGGRCPIVDTWWQTETGAIMISPLPGATSTMPGTATRPLPGIDAAVVSRDGVETQVNEGGLLVVRKPWPSMLRTLLNDDDRYRQQYWSDVKGYYFTGDGARKDQNGNFWILGRVDDVLNVSGHRLSTMEVESALVSHNQVAEAAVVARPDDLTGEAIVAFVTLKSGNDPSDELKQALRQHVVKEIGALARPSEIRFTDALPKTRSGKIMRRLLRDVAAGRESTGDTTTLDDFTVLAKLRHSDED